MWYMCTMEYYSAIKKNEIMPSTATWRDLEIAILNEISQIKKDRYYMKSDRKRQVSLLICGIFKNGTNELFYRTHSPGLGMGGGAQSVQLCPF